MNTEEENNEFFSKFGIKQKEISSAAKKVQKKQNQVLELLHCLEENYPN